MEGQSPQKTPPKKRSIWRPCEPHRRKWFGQWHEKSSHSQRMFTSKPSFGTFRDSVRVLSSDIDVFYTWNFRESPKKKQRLLEIRTSIHFGNQWIFERPNFETRPKCDVHRATVLLSSSKFTKYEIWVPDFCLISLQHVELVHTLFKKSTSGFTKKNSQKSNQHISPKLQDLLIHPQVIQFVTFWSLNVGLVTFHPFFKGHLKLNHPKKVTAWITRPFVFWIELRTSCWATNSP